MFYFSVGFFFAKHLYILCFLQKHIVVCVLILLITVNYWTSTDLAWRVSLTETLTSRPGGGGSAEKFQINNKKKSISSTFLHPRPSMLDEGESQAVLIWLGFTSILIEIFRMNFDKKIHYDQDDVGGDVTFQKLIKFNPDPLQT